MKTSNSEAVEVTWPDRIDHVAYVGGDPSSEAAGVLATEYRDEPVPPRAKGA